MGFVCDTCGVEFDNRDVFDIHVKIHKLEPAQRTELESDLTCIDKISANIEVEIKFDPKTLNWYVKDTRFSHAKFLDSAKLKSWEWKDEALRG